MGRNRVTIKRCVVTEFYLRRVAMALRGELDEAEIDSLKNNTRYYIRNSEKDTREVITFRNPRRSGEE